MSVPSLWTEPQSIPAGRGVGGCQENLFTKSGDQLGLEELATPVLTYGSGNTPMQPRNPNCQPPGTLRDRATQHRAKDWAEAHRAVPPGWVSHSSQSWACGSQTCLFPGTLACVL